ncbi:bifunctional oligoribonuclease/PAP phosphatase NrnA [Candidatus Peregrinibacteria bacterium]|nr:bifunctional oligoribonuclease/PAP phosphatase NrnA [Candidatus Peregrinibacteria bacterium]
MEISDDIAGNIFDTLKNAQHVLIISHRHPDADTIGSNVALRLILERHGIKVTSACVDKIGPGTEFLPHGGDFINTIDPEDFDVYVSVDAGSISQSAFPEKFPAMLNKQKPFITIDHHPSNLGYGTLNLVVSNAASTTLVLYHLFQKWKEKITPPIATTLLYGLYYDTGSFMHSNTCEDVYQVAGTLMSLGADQKSITKHLFKERTIEQLKLWGSVLENMTVNDNKVVQSAVQNKTLEDIGATNHQLSGVIDYLSMTKENRFATLLCEDGTGQIRGSFRTRRDDVDVGGMAQSLGGGGHKKASGFTIQGNLEEKVRWSILPEKDQE